MFEARAAVLAKLTVLQVTIKADFIEVRSMLKELVIAFAIMGLCLVIHIAGVVFLGEQLVRRREKIERKASFTYTSLLLMTVFSLIILLHVAEACIWAVLYYARGLFKDFETALYFSMKSYSTVGYGDVLLPHEWRLLGTVEAIAGVLLCGLSAAFLFAIVSAIFRFRTSVQDEIGRLKASRNKLQIRHKALKARVTH